MMPSRCASVPRGRRAVRYGRAMTAELPGFTPAGAGSDLEALLEHEREAPDRHFLDALLSYRSWGNAEVRTAAAHIVERYAQWAVDLEPGAAFLLGAVASVHQAEVLVAWLEAQGAESFESIGRQRGVTGQAVRTSVGRAARRVRAALDTAPPPWPWLVADLRRCLGAVTTEELLADALQRFGSACDTVPGLMAAWLAGPYKPVPGRPGWLARDPAELISRSVSCLRADGGVRRLVDVREELADLGFAAGQLEPWLRACGSAVLHDLVVCTSGQLADVVERVLDAHGAPRSVPQLADDLAGGGRLVDEVSLAAVVRGRRFRTTRRGAVRLASWEEEPEAGSGRRTGATAAVTAVPRQEDPAGGSGRGRGLAPSSGRSAGSAGPPVREPARRPDVPEERLWLWVRVDPDVLRGSEAAVPLALAEGLGLALESRRIFSCRWGPVTLAYEGAQPKRGSVRAVAMAAGARAGDTLLLGFSRAGDLAVEVRSADAQTDGIDPAGSAGAEGPLPEIIIQGAR